MATNTQSLLDPEEIRNTEIVKQLIQELSNNQNAGKIVIISEFNQLKNVVLKNSHRMKQ
jgi:predicted deacylase